MDREVLAEARQKAQVALSRARVATDPGTRRAWEQAAEEWMAKVIELQGGETPATPIIPFPDGKTPSP